VDVSILFSWISSNYKLQRSPFGMKAIFIQCSIDVQKFRQIYQCQIMSKYAPSYKFNSSEWINILVAVCISIYMGCKLLWYNVWNFYRPWTERNYFYFWLVYFIPMVTLLIWFIVLCLKQSATTYALNILP
jgi:hypothetical protein